MDRLKGASLRQAPSLHVIIRLVWENLARDKDSSLLRKLVNYGQIKFHMAALVPDMLCNFYLLKNCKLGNNSVATEAREKISTHLESNNFLMYF